MDAKKKALSLFAAAALSTACMVPGLAFAAETGTHVTGAATRAASPTLEILGVDSVEEGTQFVTLVNNVPQYTWAQPKYFLCAYSYNAPVSPYLYNLANGIDETGALAAVINTGRTGGGAGPDAALASTSSSDTDDIAVWNMKPDVVVGDGNGVDYTADGYVSIAGYAAPAGIDYAFQDNSDLIDSMYRIADAADGVVSANKTLRYGSAGDIALDYEAYVRGIQGYVLQQIEDQGLKTKTVASVASYNNGYYTIRVSNVQEGSASTNRYLEACEVVADNLANTLGTTTVTASELAQADLVLVGGQNSDTSTQNALLSQLASDGIESIYYVQNNGSAGSMYGVIMNSVENAQNIGRILGCLYDTAVVEETDEVVDLLDQDALVGYYYQHFYHISDGLNGTTDYVDYVVQNAMNGVYREATGTTSWSGFAYDSADDGDMVQGWIDGGVQFLHDWMDDDSLVEDRDFPAVLTLSDDLYDLFD